MVSSLHGDTISKIQMGNLYRTKDVVSSKNKLQGFFVWLVWFGLVCFLILLTFRDTYRNGRDEMTRISFKIIGSM